MPKIFRHNKPVKRLPIKKIVLVALASILLMGVGAFALHKMGVIDLPFLSDNSDGANNDGINYGPPTDEEKQETETYKDSLGEQQANQSQNSQPGQNKQVTPTISSWGQNNAGNVEVAGYVDGVLESSGKCIVKLEKSGQVINSSPQPATPNAQNVSCGFITIERARLSPGKWNVSLLYESPNAQGTSQSLTLEVQ